MQVYLIVSTNDGSNVDVKSSLHRAEAVAYNLNQRFGSGSHMVQKCIIQLSSAQAQLYLLKREIKFYLAVAYCEGASLTCAGFSTQEEAQKYIDKIPMKMGNWLIEEWDFKKDMSEEDKKGLGLMEDSMLPKKLM